MNKQIEARWTNEIAHADAIAARIAAKAAQEPTDNYTAALAIVARTFAENHYDEDMGRTRTGAKYDRNYPYEVMGMATKAVVAAGHDAPLADYVLEAFLVEECRLDAPGSF